MLKEQKGITLVALVITIIVLIILAGISITMVLGEDGLINKSKRGADNYSRAAAAEQTQLDNVNSWLEEKGY
ncbi:MAG: hypothetical protein J6M60_07705 [Clostridia bacterium]|nr:hypothetical protein [Clostridia bacterium]